MKPVLTVALLLVLAGCGRAQGLKPAVGETMPPAPYGAVERPTSADLLTPAPQARPQRGDELLKQSQQRRSDEFDLPPR